MEIVICPDATEAGRLGANAIVALLQRKPDAVLGLATGSSPMAIYDELVRRRQSGEVSFAQARFPQHLTAMVELLEPFGEELAKVK